MKRRAIRGVFIGLAAAALLAYLGALGTGPAPLSTRFAYWAAVILPGSLIGLAVTTLVRGCGGLARHRWLEIAVVSLLVSLPHCFVVIVASALFFGIEAITPMLVLQFWLAVLVLTVALTVINYLASGAEGLSVPANAAPAAPAEPLELVPVRPPEMPAAAPALPSLPPLLADKLSIRLSAGRLVAIEAEDHYLRIHTDLGSDLVLMRLSDACALLQGVEGARVHRSWWVARAAVVAINRTAGRMDLVLSGGQIVPVSRAMQPAIKADRWP
jgi:hypothetical protein